MFNFNYFLLWKKKIPKKKKDELMPLNENLYNEFSLEKLEERLETDPLVIGDLIGEQDVDSTTFCLFQTCVGKDCNEFTVIVG